MRPVVARMIDVARRFLRWWLAELAALLPETVRGALAPTSEVVCVDLTGPEVVVARHSGTRRRELARCPMPDSVPGAAMPTLPRRQLASADHIVLRLPSHRALSKRVVLPAAAEGSLRDVLYFELDRQTPFRPEEVYFDHRQRERLPGGQRIVVDLTVVARAVVDPVLAWLARAGLEPDRLEGEAADGTTWTCRLPARDGGEDGGRRKLAKSLNPALATLAVVLAGFAAYLPVLRQEASLQELRRELAAEKARADETLALQEQLTALREEAVFLVGQKRQSASLLAVWDEITRIMPDHSFVLEFRLRQGQVDVIGESRAATGLLEVIDNSPLFHEAAFRSPITRGAGGDAERFHLGFQVGRSELEAVAERP